jgi:hypothetical protein
MGPIKCSSTFTMMSSCRHTLHIKAYEFTDHQRSPSKLNRSTTLYNITRSKSVFLRKNPMYIPMIEIPLPT